MHVRRYLLDFGCAIVVVITVNVFVVLLYVRKYKFNTGI